MSIVSGSCHHIFKSYMQSKYIISAAMPALFLISPAGFAAMSHKTQQVSLIIAHSSVYLGADVSFASKLRMKNSANTYTTIDDTNTAYNIVLGYEFPFGTQVKLSAEAQYRRVGDVTYTSATNVDGELYLFNLKPKLYLTNAHHWYLGGTAGVGHGKFSATTAAVARDFSGVAYQYGAEIGYRFSSGIDTRIGYSVIRADNFNYSGNEIDSTLTGFYAGVKYYF